MSIKFKCPQCHKALSVKDEMAGKKGTCPGCKKVLVVPAAPVPGTTNGLAANGSAPKPAPRPVDVEAEAAAILGEKPPEQPSEAVATTMAFKCPMCDEPIQVAADLAGKNTPCPLCRRIIKVPLLKKAEKIDWKKPNAGLPSLARQDVAPVEGVWDNQAASRVSAEVLEEAGALPELREPRTIAQRVQLALIAGAGVAFLVAGFAFVSHRAKEERETNSLEQALEYLKSDAARQQLGPVGEAELHRAAGLFFLGTRRENCATAAQGQFDDAFRLLRDSKGPANDTERDLALSELAPARVELGGTGEDVDEGRRLDWKENKYQASVQKMVLSTLSAIHNRELRLEALRPVLRRVISNGQPKRAFAVANQAFGTAADNNTERLYSMDAKAVAGMELLVADHQVEASQVADLLQEEYGRPHRPPLASTAVALLMALGRPALKAGKVGTDTDNELAGTAEGLARQGDVKKARALIESAHPRLKMQAQLNLAAAAVDARANDPSDLIEAFRLEAESRRSETPPTPWVQWRLLQLGLRVPAVEERLRSVVDERLKQLVDALPEGALRARGRLALLQGRLARSGQAETEDVVQDIPEQSVARALAYEALARHNIRHDKHMAQKTLEWPQPYSAFGSLGLALGLQDD